MKAQYLETIKRFEGFSAQAKWDFAQHSNGYGTKALYPGEVIDKKSAEHRFAAEIASAKAAVARFAPGLDEGTTAALTSLTFNAGPGWMRSGLGAAVKAGDLDAAKQVFVRYVHAGGQRLAGLEARRAVEVQWIGEHQSAVPDGGGGKAALRPVMMAEAKDVLPEREEFRNGLTPTVANLIGEPSVPRSPGPGDDLVQTLVLETIAAIFAALRSRDDHDIADTART